MKRKLLSGFGMGITALLLASAANAQTSFSTATTRFTDQTMYSGNCMTVIDWNNDGLDDVVRLEFGRYVYVEIQKPGNQFESRYFGDMGGSDDWAWGMAVADVDGNGYKDVIAGGYSAAIKIFKIDATGMTATSYSLPSSNFFLQNVTCGDFDNDGDIDIFCCDDNAAAHIYVNNGSGIFTLSSLINFDVTATDDSGNYGSAWTDYDNDGDLDLYIAKCRQSVSNPADGRRINVLFRNNGDGTFTESAAAANLNVGWQTWTASFGDLDNDADMDVMLTNHDHTSQIFVNDGSGVYTENTTTGFSTLSTPQQGYMADFDNDGYLDILVSGVDEELWHNNGDMTFTKLTGIFDNNDMLSFGVGDLNHDGFMDVQASYGNIYNDHSATPDQLWLNDRNANHYLVFDLRGTVSNDGAVGAKVTITGPFGTQIREVRVGESYGNINTSMCHFGLGTATTVTSATIEWPSGITQVINNPAVDNFITVIENDCVSPTGAITSTGSMVLCGAGTVQLDAPAGYSYLWSTGATTQSITVSATGEYQVQIIQSGNNCPGQLPMVEVTNSPDETPTISAAGATEFCLGDNVVINGPAGATGYSWSSGETTQDITATQSGSYTLTITGACQNWTSAPVVVNVLEATLPTTSDVTIPAAGSATLNATGTNLTWWDAPTGGTQVGTGSPFNTPVVSVQTTFYVENSEAFGGGTANGGMTTAPGLYSANGTNATMSFDVLEACTMKTAVLYTDTPGSRIVELRNQGGTLLDTALVTLINGTNTCTLNFSLTPGTGYYLTTDGAYNNTSLGFAGPRLQRSNAGVSYPYAIGTAVSLTGSSAGASFYYYFYDIQIEYPSYNCPSQRADATVFIANGVNELAVSNFSLYPNPANEVVNIQPAKGISAYSVEVVDVTGRMIWVNSNANGTTRLDVSNWTSGVYFVRLNSANGKTVQKIVVE